MYRFRSSVWKWKGDSAWHFATLPFEVSDEIEERTAHTRRGFGSVRVRVTIGATTWDTSVFPDKTAESYLLPIKAAVRTSERIVAGDDVEIELRVVEPDAL